MRPRKSRQWPAAFALLGLSAALGYFCLGWMALGQPSAAGVRRAGQRGVLGDAGNDAGSSAGAADSAGSGESGSNAAAGENARRDADGDAGGSGGFEAREEGGSTSSRPVRPKASTVRCVGGNETLPAKVFGHEIVNRTCLFENLLLRNNRWYFVASGDPAAAVAQAEVPAVSLAPKPILVGKRSFPKKYPGPWGELLFGYRWKPTVLPFALAHNATTPSPEALRGITAMYSPEVAPWNYAHTLLNDLFPLFWGLSDLLQPVPVDTRLVVLSALYDQPFQPDRKKWLPQNNAFRSFSRTPPTWSKALSDACGAAGCLVEKLVVGSGMRSWAAVTESYAAPGSGAVWDAYRRHIYGVLRVSPRPRGAVGGRTERRMVVCDKKSDSRDNKRGIVNTRDVARWAEEYADAHSERTALKAQTVLLSNLPIKEQTQLMADTDIFLCNEGTLGTAFFLMPPGSVWYSVMNVFRRDVHYDLYRPYSQRHLFWNTGGNIDWFAPAIPWVKAVHYDRYLMADVTKDATTANFRNYLPNWSVSLNKTRFLKPFAAAIRFLDAGATRTDSDNHSVMGRLCGRIMRALPHVRPLFTSVKCAYGMSWLCEYLVNGHSSLRDTHPKWKRGCGHLPSLQELGIEDERDAWLAEEGIDEEPRAIACPKPPLLPHPCTVRHPCCADGKT
ncbi:glycosyltransferase [Diplonema papillatum]|nr:glycosyltransferase [Diplonema papillatum]